MSRHQYRQVLARPPRALERSTASLSRVPARTHQTHPHQRDALLAGPGLRAAEAMVHFGHLATRVSALVQRREQRVAEQLGQDAVEREEDNCVGR